MPSKLAVYDIEFSICKGHRKYKKIGYIFAIGAHSRNRFMRKADEKGRAKIVRRHDLETLLVFGTRIYHENSTVGCDAWNIVMSDLVNKYSPKFHKTRLQKLTKRLLFAKEMEQDA